MHIILTATLRPMATALLTWSTTFGDKGNDLNKKET